MQYKQSRDIKKNFTQFINKVFALNEEWVNSDVEIVSLSDANSPKAFEQYPWDSENYPLVVVFSEGSSDDHWAIDSKIGVYWETLLIGQRPRDYIQLGSNPIAFGVKATQTSMSIRAVDIAIQYIGPYEDDIVVKLWDSSNQLPNTVLASGSVAGKNSTRMQWKSAAIYPTFELTANTDYFISVEVPSGSYYLMLDNDPDMDITPFVRFASYSGGSWSLTSSTSTVLARVNGPAYQRLGGGQDGSIRIFIESKDLATSQKIADLLFIYFHLAKHSNPKRKVKISIPNQTGMDYDFVSSLTDEGIYIIDVSKGAEAVRVRGNDRLFSIDLIVSCYSSWIEDFALPTIEDINLDVDTY